VGNSAVMTSTTGDVSRAARRASDSRAFEVLARLGLGARAFIYVVMGLLAAAVAAGRSRQETDQRGALNAVADQSGGKVLLVALCVGFAGYALWRLSEAAFGVAGQPGKKGPRVQSLVRGVAYALFTVTAVSILAGSGRNKSQAQQQRTLSGRLLQHSGGRLLLAVVGVVIVVVGLAMVVEGVTRKFTRYLRLQDMTHRTRAAVEKLGMVGTAARGLIFALAGGLVVDAAARANASKATGLDGALRTLAQQAYGTVLLALAAGGLVVFGLYGFAEARWHKT